MAECRNRVIFDRRARSPVRAAYPEIASVAGGCPRRQRWANSGHSVPASARAVVIASDARYRRPAVPNLEAFEGASVHYWASPLEAKLCAGQEVALVGAGNSAAQAVVYLATQVRKVWLLVRGPEFGSKDVALSRRPHFRTFE